MYSWSLRPPAACKAITLYTPTIFIVDLSGGSVVSCSRKRDYAIVEFTVSKNFDSAAKVVDYCTIGMLCFQVALFLLQFDNHHCRG
jgi:hypothetical protein